MGTATEVGSNGCQAGQGGGVVVECTNPTTTTTTTITTTTTTTTTTMPVIIGPIGPDSYDSYDCYDHDPRFLTHIGNSDDNTPNHCAQRCRDLGYSLFGVEDSNNCACGDDWPSNDLKIGWNQCQYACKGDSSQICGGYFAIIVGHVSGSLPNSGKLHILTA